MLIRGATLVDAERGPRTADLRIAGGDIAEIGALAPHPDEEVLDGRGHLLVPGLVNAHLHSIEAPFRGRYENLPLELWFMLPWPIDGAPRIPDRLLHLRTLLIGIESLRGGVTSVLDDLDEWGGQTADDLAPVFAAYAQLGLRASCSGTGVDLPFVDSFPFADETIPPDVRARMRGAPPGTVEEAVLRWEEMVARYHGTQDGRLRVVVAPVAPQWCTPELMQAAHDVARRHDLNYHVHVLETRTQRVAAQRRGGSVVAAMDDLGVLGPATTLAHGIWLDEQEMATLAERGCSVVHNPISNLKIGAGVAPLRALLGAGVNVGLGTDGQSTNDTAALFDVMRVAGLLHGTGSADSVARPSARDIVRCATAGGAQAAHLARVGQIAVGCRADLVLLDLDTIAFTPMSDPCRSLVYSEDGSSVRTVLVDGRVVFCDGRVVGVDEAAVIAEFRELATELQAEHARLEAAHRPFMPHVRRMLARADAVDVDLARWL